MKAWEKIDVKLDDGKIAEAIAPIIISASRSTDIPAFYSEWFFNRLNRGYLTWINPFNRQEQHVSFKNCRLIVFWTKNPEPIIPYLEILDRKGINYYFHYTLNDYEIDGLEPNVPELSKRISTFKKLSQLLGKEKVIWRFDPLILTNQIKVHTLLDKIKKVGEEIHRYTNKLVISFADINEYKKVQNNLQKGEVNYEEFSKEKMIELAKGLQKINEIFKLKIGTCAEDIDLFNYGIDKNRCIDDELIVELFKEDRKLMNFIGYTPNTQLGLFDESYKYNPKLKDKGQRKICGCIISKDIGMYNTCNHLCTYCYANHSANIVKKNVESHNYSFQSIIK